MGMQGRPQLLLLAFNIHYTSVSGILLSLLLYVILMLFGQVLCSVISCWTTVYIASTFCTLFVCYHLYVTILRDGFSQDQLFVQSLNKILMFH